MASRMDYEIDFCKNCKNKRLIVNKRYLLCDDCNYQRLHKGKTRYQIAKEKERIKKDKKVNSGTGELKMFMEIWSERPHKSELTDEKLLPITNVKWVNQFLHVLPKSMYPKFRLNKDNILLGLPEEHDKQETYQIFKDKKEQLRQEYRKLYG